MIKVLSVFGTRPEAIKMCPLVLELQARPGIRSMVCVTAQHRELLDNVLERFNVTADYDLNIMRPGQTLEQITAAVVEGIAGVIRQAAPELVLVHGDTSTSFCAALAAFYAQVPVGHVEAGLRTYNPLSPFPEEMNRTLIGRIATYHFCPTAQNAENLRREGISKNIFITGNTVIDAMKYTVAQGRTFTEPRLRNFDFDGKRVIAMTCHRRENYGQPMADIFSAVARIAAEFEDVHFIYPVHPSPVVREAANTHLGQIPNVHLLEPLDAMDMHLLMSRSYMVMTDSGGIQEEAPALGKPVLVLRRETERPEAIEAGTVKLAGITAQGVWEAARRLLTDADAYRRMAFAVNPYGDGNACRRTADAIEYSFGALVNPPEDFRP